MTHSIASPEVGLAEAVDTSIERRESELHESGQASLLDSTAHLDVESLRARREATLAKKIVAGDLRRSYARLRLFGFERLTYEQFESGLRAEAKLAGINDERVDEAIRLEADIKAEIDELTAQLNSAAELIAEEKILSGKIVARDLREGPIHISRERRDEVTQPILDCSSSDTDGMYRRVVVYREESEYLESGYREILALARTLEIRLRHRVGFP